ncbi:hypothetical protein EG835_10725 [bacterium]|nr:hypothetical protein [bacterium]
MTNGTVLVGVMRATIVVVTPMQHVQVALAALLMPVFSERIHRGLAVPRGRLILGLVGLALLYFAGLLVAGDELMTLLYGGAIEAPAKLAATFGCIPVLTAAITVTQAELMASSRLRAVFASYLGGCLTSLTVGLALVAGYGVTGAAGAALSACGAVLAIQYVALARRDARPTR